MFNISKNKSTMIGSMPHKNIDNAFDLLNKYPLSIPAWPQLPKVSFKEAMIPQYSEGFPGIKIDENEKKVWVERDGTLVDQMTTFFENMVENKLDTMEITDEYAKGFHYFINELKKTGKKIPLVKGQLTGPFTFGLGLNDNEKKAVWFDEQYRDIVINGLKMKALWQVKKLKEAAENIVIFFDEPILSALGTPAYIMIKDEDVTNTLNELIDALHEEGVMAGTHCCGNMDWGLLAKTKLDIIAFDAYFFGDKISLYPDEISKFLERGGILAYGIVPTGDVKKLYEENPGSLKQKVEELKKTFIQKGLKKELLDNNIILTPSCGFGSGSYSEKDAELVLKLLNEIQG